MKVVVAIVVGQRRRAGISLSHHRERLELGPSPSPSGGTRAAGGWWRRRLGLSISSMLKVVLVTC